MCGKERGCNMEEWAIFTDRETGRELCAYTIRGTFPGEKEDTKQLLSFKKGIPVEQIETHIEKRPSKCLLNQTKDRR